MRIKRIHLFNFRSVEDLTLDLTEDGLHALIGAFGSGKSTFLTGARFALFGDNGEAGNNTDLRRRGCPTGEPAGCEVTFTHGQDTYVARRWLRLSNTKNGKQEKTAASLSVNGVELDGITPSTLTKEMEDVLGLTARSWASASMIPQGEVATLMKATPTEVQALIEGHTGLDKLTKKRDQARVAAKEAETIAQNLPGDVEEVWNLGEQVKDAAKEMESTASEQVAAREKKDIAAAAAKSAEDHLRNLYTQREQAIDHEKQVALSQQRVVAATTALEDRRGEAREAGVDLSADAKSDTREIAHIDRQLDEVDNAGRTLVEAHRRVSEAVEEARNVETKMAEAGKADADVAKELEQLAQRQQVLMDKRTQANKVLQKTHGQFSEAKARNDELTKAIEALSDSHGDGHSCPTCRQEVTDYAALIAGLRKQATQFIADMDSAKREAVNARTEEQQVAGELDSIDQRRTVLERQRLALDMVRKEVEQTQGRLQNARSELATIRANMVALVAGHGYKTAGADDDTLLSYGRELHRKFRTRRNDLAHATHLRTQVTTAEIALEKARQNDATITSKTAESPSPQAIADAENSATAAREQLANASEAVTEAVRMHSSAESAHSVVKAQLDDKRAEWAYKVEAIRKATILRGEADVLAALRTDLLTEYTASICRSASDMLASFGGEYVAFHLGDDFVPRAELSDGTLVRTAILSGGEAALVGLSFRVGITLVVTGGGLPEQIIGDEVTNYLDEDGRRVVLEVLKRIFPNVLLISHTDEVENYATQVHRVVRQELGPTQWHAEPTSTESTETAEVAA